MFFRSAVRWLLGAKTATGRPKMATRRPKTATRRAKMAPRCAQDAPEGPRCPKGRPRWTKTAPRWPAMASRWLKMVQNAARWPKMAPTWPQDGRPSTDGYGCVSFCRPPPADRCFESFAARRPPADAYRDVGRYAARRPPPARRCIEIRQDVPQGFPIKRAGVVSNLVPSCSREL